MLDVTLLVTRDPTTTRREPVAEATGFRGLRAEQKPALAGFCSCAKAKVLHPADESTAIANLASQVGAVRSIGNAYLRRRLPLRVCWFT